MNNIIYANNELITTLSNILYIFIFLFAALYYFYNASKHNKEKAKEQQKEIDIYKEQKRREKQVSQTGVISNYLNLVEYYFELKGHKKPHDSLLYTLIVIAIVSLVIAFSTSMALGLMSFLFFNLLISVIIKNLNETKSNKSEYKLPEVIDTIIRSFSKNDVLQVVIYETSLGIKEPFKTLFGNIAREMTSSEHKTVLDKYGKKTTSIWMNSLFSILIKYKEDAKKEDTIANLKHLRDMISQENELKRKLVSDKRYSVVLNYILATVGIIGNVIILIFFPAIFKSAYLSSPFGISMLISGYGCVLAIVLTTKKLGNKNEIKVEDN